jgi:hypothetical protein
VNAPTEVDRPVPGSIVKLGGEATNYWHRARSSRSTLRVFAFVFLLVISAPAAEQPLAQSTIVLYNKDVPDSVELAKFYAEQRAIDPIISLGSTVRPKKKSAAKSTIRPLLIRCVKFLNNAIGGC